ncbi:MAG: thioredoxin domain-containing protein [Deinococcales bacterium]
MKRYFRGFIFISSLVILGLAQITLASLGERPEKFLANLAHLELSQDEEGHFHQGQNYFKLSLREGLLYRLSGESLLDEEGIAFTAAVLGSASGYGSFIEEPVKQFLTSGISELVGQGPVGIPLEEFLLDISLVGEKPYTLYYGLSIREIPTGAFPKSKHTLGPENARYVIREFSDLECPYCARFASEALPMIQSQLLSRGDVRFEYHHFPLTSIHPHAVLAAEASECVAEVNGETHFWSYHQALFQRQSAWAVLSDPTSYFIQIAREIGLSDAMMSDCLVNHKYRQEVLDALTEATRKLNIPGTPTIFINGFKLQPTIEESKIINQQGIYPYAFLEMYLQRFQMIDAFSQE